MNTRIQQFLNAEDLTPTRFADAIGVQRSNVSHILSGRNNPGYDFIVKMLQRYPSLNAEWLLLGKGSMYKEAYMPSLFDSNQQVATAIDAPPVAEEALPKIATASIDKPENTIIQPKSDKQLVKVLFCYNDGSFEAFDK